MQNQIFVIKESLNKNLFILFNLGAYFKYYILNILCLSARDMHYVSFCIFKFYVNT